MLRDLARAFVAVGTQSIGGGTSTLFLMRRLVVERHRWLTPREFTEHWALSQLSPGIHLVALAAMVGRHLGGWRGVAVAVAAMMVPAAIVTAAMTAVYGEIAHHPVATAALAGMAPATGGMTLALALLMLRDARRHGRGAIVDVLIALAAFAFLLATSIPGLLVIAVSALVGVVFLGRERPTSERAE